MDGFRRNIIIREEKRIKGVITRKAIFYYAGIKDRSHKEQASNCKGEGGDFHPILRHFTLTHDFHHVRFPTNGQDMMRQQHSHSSLNEYGRILQQYHIPHNALGA